MPILRQVEQFRESGHGLIIGKANMGIASFQTQGYDALQRKPAAEEGISGIDVEGYEAHNPLYYRAGFGIDVVSIYGKSQLNVSCDVISFSPWENRLGKREKSL